MVELTGNVSWPNAMNFGKRITLIAILLWMLAAGIDSASAGTLFSAGQTLLPEPSAEIVREGSQTKISFNGILLSTDNVNGPWAVLTNATSPYIPDLGSPSKFHLAREPFTTSIFSSRSVVAFNLTAPFQIYFDMAYAGVPDGIFPPAREKPYFDGTLSLPGLIVPVSLRVRGNSSLQECPFPKLKFKVSSENRPGTPFADAREIKIGTHCAEGGRGTIGRLRDQSAVFREVLAYEILDLLEFIAPRVRRARIDYHDTTPPTSGTAIVGWQLTRDAMLLEDIEVLAARLGARALSEAELTALRNPPFDAQLVIDLQLLHALLGNWDYSLGSDSQGVWNTEVLEFPDRRLVPVAGDFDLSSWVTGIPLRTAPNDYHPELDEIERETLYKVERIKHLVDPLAFNAAVQRFALKRAAIEALVNSAKMDDEGRANALRHTKAFYDALAIAR